MATFEGAGVNRFVAITLKTGLKLYRDTGIKPNRDWTPTNMMRKASQITGKTFKARDYSSAIKALQEWLDATC